MKRKIIEVNFPTKRVSEYGSLERYVRKAHPYGAKTWWARRPLTSIRSLVFATAADEGDDDIEMVEKLSQDVTPSLNIIQKAKERIKNSYGDFPPRIIDFFSGGGGIPFEAARLGMESHSLELNPVAVLSQKAVFGSTQLYPEINRDIEFWGRTIIDRAQKAFEHFFANPLKTPIGNDEPIVYFWSRTVKCPNCGIVTPLSRLSYLSKRSKRTITIHFDPKEGNGGTWIIREVPGSGTPQTVPHRNKHNCLFCSQPISSEYLKKEGEKKRIGRTLQAIALLGSAYQGKRYVSSSEVNQEKLPNAKELNNAIKSLEERIGRETPKFPLKRWSGIVNPTVYGYLTADELFDDRQLLVLLSIVHELRKAHSEMIDSGMQKEKADSVILILSSLVDHLADWNSAFTMWIPQNEQCGRSLAGPGIPMLWDYIEINPFGSGPANLRDKLSRIIESIEAVPKLDIPIEIRQGSALELPYPDKFFDIAVVDPPYHDSLFYSALSDCFFPWQKLLLEGTVLPYDSFALMDDKNEIVASKHRWENGTIASQRYGAMMEQALQEANRVLKPDGYLTMLYSHKTYEGWTTIANAIREAELSVIQAWPLYMERKARPRAMKSDALASVIALIMRKRTVNQGINFSSDLRKQIERELKEHFSILQQNGWLGTDILIACVGKSLVYFTAGSNLVNELGEPVSFEDYLKEIEKMLHRVIYGENPDELWNTGIVKNLDVPTKIYLAWRKKYGENALTISQFRELCKSIDKEGNYKDFIMGNSPFQRSINKVVALCAEERDLDAIQRLPVTERTYIDKIHLLISSKISNDHHVNQTLEYADSKEYERIITILTILGGTQLTSLYSRRLEPEKLAVRKLLSRLTSWSHQATNNEGKQLTLFKFNKIKGRI